MYWVSDETRKMLAEFNSEDEAIDYIFKLLKTSKETYKVMYNDVCLLSLGRF